MTKFKLISGIILVLIGVIGGAYFGMYLLVMGIIEIFKEGNIAIGVLLILGRTGVSIIIGILFGLMGFYLITDADKDIENGK